MEAEQSNVRSGPWTAGMPVESGSRSRGLLPLTRQIGVMPSPNGPLDNLAQIQSVKPSCRVAEIVRVSAHAIHHGEEEVRHRRLLAVHDASARLDQIATAA